MSLSPFCDKTLAGPMLCRSWVVSPSSSKSLRASAMLCPEDIDENQSSQPWALNDFSTLPSATSPPFDIRVIEIPHSGIRAPNSYLLFALNGL